jgi:hypothetical protein
LTRAGKEKVLSARRHWVRAHENSEHFFGKKQLVLLRETLREIAESPRLPEAFQ